MQFLLWSWFQIKWKCEYMLTGRLTGLDWPSAQCPTWAVQGLAGSAGKIYNTSTHTYTALYWVHHIYSGVLILNSKYRVHHIYSGNLSKYWVHHIYSAVVILVWVQCKRYRIQHTDYLSKSVFSYSVIGLYKWQSIWYMIDL